MDSNALVSVDVSDSENEAAMLRAFQDGIATAGKAPLSLSLDNIEEQRRKQEAMRRTREERADPVKLEFLKQTLLDLGIDDSGHRLALDLAYYPRDSIVDGIGIFQAKSQLGTVPSDAEPGRYLRGIIHNAYGEAELSLTAEFHLRNRLYLRDLGLRGLVAQDEKLRQHCFTAQQQLWASVDRALAAPATIDYHFWAMRSAEILSGANLADRRLLYRSATKRIAASYRTERLRKQSLLARLARVLSE